MSATPALGEGFGPKCPAGNACENRVFLEEYEKVDDKMRRHLQRQVAELRTEVTRLEAALVDMLAPEEKRHDGKMVRKDRWETGLRNIAGILYGSSAKWDIDAVVERVRELAALRVTVADGSGNG